LAPIFRVSFRECFSRVSGVGAVRLYLLPGLRLDGGAELCEGLGRPAAGVCTGARAGRTAALWAAGVGAWLGFARAICLIGSYDFSESLKISLQDLGQLGHFREFAVQPVSNSQRLFMKAEIIGKPDGRASHLGGNFDAAGVPNAP
jgi:hypothetical protein